MKTLSIGAFGLFLALAAWSAGPQPDRFLRADFPPCSGDGAGTDGVEVVILDATDDQDCTTGGASTTTAIPHSCWCDGPSGTWLALDVTAGLENHHLITVDSSGNVGIGTSSPGPDLHLNKDQTWVQVHIEASGGSVPASWILRSNQNNGRFAIVDDNNGTTPVRVEPNADTGLLTIGETASDAIGVNGDLLVSGAASSLGDLGAGTDSPSANFHVLSSGTEITAAAATDAVIQDSGLATGQADLSIVGGTSGRSAINLGDTASESIGRIVYDHTTDSMNLETSSASALSINSSGVVFTENELGVKTSAPEADFHVLSSGTEFTLDSDTDAAIQDSGAVGDDAFLSLISGTSGQSGINLGDTGNELEARIIFNHGGNSLNLFTGGSPRMQITSSGIFLNDALASANSTHVCWDGAGGSFLTSCTSSVTQKSQIEDLDVNHAERVLSSLRPRTYLRDAGGNEIGFLVEEVAHIDQRLSVGPDGMQLNTDGLVAVNAAVLRDLLVRVRALESGCEKSSAGSNSH